MWERVDGDQKRKAYEECGALATDKLKWMDPQLEDCAYSGAIRCPNLQCTNVLGLYCYEGGRCKC